MATQSRRERPAKPALTRDGIIGAAVAIMGDEGLERVTMRRLAQELDTGPASLYVYVRNTAELHAAILDDRLGTLSAPTRGDWHQRLAGRLWSYTELLFDHPSLARVALVTRPSGPHYLALLDSLLGLLRDGGLPDDRAAWAVDLLLLYATSIAAEQGARAGAVDAADEEDALAAAIRTADPARHPNVAGIGAALLAGPGEDRWRWAVDVLLAGALATPRPEPEEESR